MLMLVGWRDVEGHAQQARDELTRRTKAEAAGLESALGPLVERTPCPK